MIFTDSQLARMTDAAYKKVLTAVPTYPYAYTLNKRREAALLAKEARRFRHPLYIVEPLEHGNGGWYGSTVLAVVSATKVLEIDPVRDYLNGHYEPIYGSRIRASLKPHPNSPVYLWDHDGGRWLNRNGHALVGRAKEQHDRARDKRKTTLARAYARIRVKLTKAERKLLKLGS